MSGKDKFANYIALQDAGKDPERLSQGQEYEMRGQGEELAQDLRNEYRDILVTIAEQERTLEGEEYADELEEEVFNNLKEKALNGNGRVTGEDLQSEILSKVIPYKLQTNEYIEGLDSEPDYGDILENLE